MATATITRFTSDNMPDLSATMTDLYMDKPAAEMQNNWLLSPGNSGYPFSGDRIARSTR